MVKSRLSKIATAAVMAAGAAFLAACGGGGGGSTPPPTTGTPPPTSQGPTWTQGVFAPSGDFDQQCATPRVGSDINGDPFPDVQGALIDELFWLRSWSDETYLWNDEIVDRNPSTFNDRLAYFEQLKSGAVTASGAPRDQFHFTEPTDEFLESRQSVPSSSYGVSYVAFSTSPPRDFRVRYTEPNSPASAVVNNQTNFVRGARILEVDGVDLVNSNSQSAIDTLNAGLFPATAGETHTFLVRDPGSTTSRTITLTSQDLSVAPVNRTRIVDTPTGKVGYILFNTFSPFSSEEAIASAFSEMSNAGVSDLVLDLRYNGGGLLAVASQVGYMVAGPNSLGQTFDRLVVNNNPRNPYSTDDFPFQNRGQGFSLSAGTPLDSVSLNRVFILSTGRTCSASESVINGLRGIDVEVVLIGGKTCGKPYGFFPTDNCGVTYFTIQFGGTNAKGFGEYSDGFLPMNSSDTIGVKIPGCSVADDFNTELGDPTEAMFAAALDYRVSGTCPPPATKVEAEKVLVSEPGMKNVATTTLRADRNDLLNGKDLTRP
jgi:hypothetical protein